jgi:hypothetical protein
MAMMLRAGTPSVPSRAIGKITCSPTVASSVAGAERTAGGTADRDAGTGLSLGASVTGLDQGVSITPSQKMVPSVRLGSSATRIRPATSVRSPGEKARSLDAAPACVPGAMRFCVPKGEKRGQRRLASKPLIAGRGNRLHAGSKALRYPRCYQLLSAAQTDLESFKPPRRHCPSPRLSATPFTERAESRRRNNVPNAVSLLVLESLCYFTTLNARCGSPVAN